MNTDNKENQIVIVTITKKGAQLGRRLRLLLPGSHLYLPEKFAGSLEAGEHAFSLPVKEAVREVFRQYRNLVLVMAVGVAVRLLATELRDKHKDPGVVVIDDAGTFAVSLLSGHLGGANRLAKRVASLLCAQPVVTTASDTSGTIAVDLLGKEFNWEIEDTDNITRVSAALVNGEPVGIYQDAGEMGWWPETKPLPDNVRIFTGIESLRQPDFSAALIITDRILEKEQLTLLPSLTITYRPKSLVVGVGCNRGTKSTEIEEAVTNILGTHGLSLGSIRNIATIDLKKDEAGLLEFARKYRLRIDYFNKKELSQAKFPSHPSAKVEGYVGTPSVCESAAILSSGNPSLVVPKERFKGAVTIAVARLAFDSQKSKGKLFLVGLGPGSPEQMTFKSKEALSQSDVVVGYNAYIELIEPFLHQKEVIATGMGAEVERAKTALNLARQGKTVSIVSSGDSGIYGMAGLVGEILREQPGDKLNVEVIPGVPSLVASAALLGTPITGDFASISLSDYLVSWEDIKRRLTLAAEGNFVIVLYNPRSKKRKHQLVEARELILRYRSPSTPVGIVTNAFREEQKVLITDLGHMLDHEIGMNTTIIIGNSTTFTVDGWMVTPRGYQTKYNLKQ
ncbi:MAG: precorrin-3B C(17)-methyltransferase [Chloroflexi bacterium]|nr:precorrin-3B C(17)-methyltransferase [Chloroflexota bacterium]